MAEPRIRHRTVGAPDATVRHARALRRSMTLPEGLLWRELRQKPGGFRFRRQFPLGPYVLDFACLEARLAIEVDGAAHDMGSNPERDIARDRWVACAGYRTLRIPARDVLDDPVAIAEAIAMRCAELIALDSTPPSVATRLPPPRSGEELEPEGSIG